MYICGYMYIERKRQEKVMQNLALINTSVIEVLWSIYSGLLDIQAFDSLRSVFIQLFRAICWIQLGIRLRLGL